MRLIIVQVFGNKVNQPAKKIVEVFKLFSNIGLIIQTFSFCEFNSSSATIFWGLGHDNNWRYINNCALLSYQ